MNTSRQAGFTLIELVIVSVIVAVLATLVAMTYSGVQSTNRNRDRQSHIKSLQSHLETYYAQNDTYPTFDNLADASWRKANLKKMNSEELRDPSWNADISQCTKDGAAIAASNPIEKCYSYQVTSADGSACDNDKTPCAQYTLTAILEGSNDKYVKSSLN